VKQHGRREPSSNEPMHAARATRQHTCKRYRPRRGTRPARSLGPSRVPPTGRNQHSRKSVAVATHPRRRRGSAPHPPAAASPPPCRRGCRPTGVAGGRPTARADRTATLPPAATPARDAPPGAGGRRRPPRRARDARGRRGARRAPAGGRVGRPPTPWRGWWATRGPAPAEGRENLAGTATAAGMAIRRPATVFVSETRTKVYGRKKK